MARVTVELNVNTAQGESSGIMLEGALERSTRDFPPAARVMAFMAVATHTSLMVIAVAVDTPAERDTRVSQHRRLSGTEHFVTARAVQIAMAPRERVAGTAVIEPVCRRPRGLRMTIGAGSIGKLPSVRVHLRVTVTTGRSQPEECSIECTVLVLERPDIGCDDQVATVTFPTDEFRMPLHQLEACFGMVERGRVEPQQVEITPEVFLVALCASLTSQCCVVTPLFRNASPQCLMTLEAEITDDTPLSQAMAVRTLPDALQVGVGGGQLAGRDQLRRGGMGAVRHANRRHEEHRGSQSARRPQPEEPHA